MTALAPRPTSGYALLTSSVLVTVALCVVLSGTRFNFSYFDGDTVSYLFQAKLFAQGRLAAPAPPDLGFSPSPHVNVDGLWYSKYPVGNALALSIGVLLGAPWLIPALATGAALVLLFGILRETYGDNVARTGLILGVISPATLVLGSVWFSEAVSRLCLALFLYLMITGVKRRGWRRGLFAGLALGYAFDTRPLTAVAIGSVVGLSLAVRYRDGRRALAACALGLALTASLTLGWNYKMTGDPFRAAFAVMQPYDRLGFGPRGNQYPLEPPPPVYAPDAAPRRIAFRTIPATLQSGFGVGYYDPHLYDWLLHGSTGTRVGVLLKLAGFLAPVVLVGLAFHSKDRFFSWLFGGVVGVSLVAYSLYFFDGSTWGFTPFHTRYQTEAIMLGLLPLAARGLVTLRERIDFGSARRRLASAAILAFLGWNYAVYWARILPSLVQRDGLAQMESAVGQVDSTRAVIFFPGATVIPLGDYPFATLDRAGIVTYRLTNNKLWGLKETDPLAVHGRYFPDREAYLFRDGTLSRLETRAAFTREAIP